MTDKLIIYQSKRMYSSENSFQGEEIDRLQQSADYHVGGRDQTIKFYSVIKGQYDDVEQQFWILHLSGTENITQNKEQIPQNKGNILQNEEGPPNPNNQNKNRRKDGHSFPRLLASKVKTIISTFLSPNTNRKASKGEKEENIAEFKKFMRENDFRENCQLIVAFLYLYLFREKASEECRKTIKVELLSYLDRRLDKTNLTQDIENDDQWKKLMINRSIVGKLFESSHMVDMNQLDDIGNKLYNKKQKNKIKTQISKLRYIQGKIEGNVKPIQYKFQRIWQS